MQLGQAAHAVEHLAAGVPDMRTELLPDLYEQMLARDDIPLEANEIDRLRRFAPRFAELCTDLASRGVPDTIQHEDKKQKNVWVKDDERRVLDWGDACVTHPFASLFIPFAFLDDYSRLPPGYLWYARLRDAYLEPWGCILVDTFDLALRVGTIAHGFSWFRQYDALPETERPDFMRWFPYLLRLGVAQADE